MTNVEISKRLREFGEKKFSSMAEFARSLGMRPQTLNNYLSGSIPIGATMREKLSKLGCDNEWLMTGKTHDEHKQQKENEELRKLREENEILKGERDALLRSLAPEISHLIISGIKRNREQTSNKKVSKNNRRTKLLLE